MERHSRSPSCQECSFRPHSLAISPNLQALLEHDERVRAGNFFGQVESPTPTSDPPATGLPPPPRGPRKQPSCPSSPHDKPGSTETLAEAARSRASSVGASPLSTPNPFINPPPVLDGALIAKLENLVISPASSPTPSFPSQTRVSRTTSSATSTQSLVKEQLKPGSEESSTSRTDLRRPLRLVLSHREPTEETVPKAKRASWASFMGKSVLTSMSSPDVENNRPRPTSMINQTRRLSKFISSSWMEVISGDDKRRRLSMTARSGSEQGFHEYEMKNTGTPNAEANFRRTQSQRTGSCPRRTNPRLSHTFTVSPAVPRDLAQPPPSNREPHNNSKKISSPGNAPSPTSYHSLTLWSMAQESTPSGSFMEMQSPTSPTPPTDTPISHPDRYVTSSVRSAVDSTPVTRNTSSRTLGPAPSTRPPSEGTPSKSLTTSQDTIKSAFFDAPPPTTNYLNAQERSELVKRSRKLASVFGQTPGAMSLRTTLDEPRPPTNSSTTTTLVRVHRHSRVAASISNDLPASALPLLEGAPDSSTGARRHSTPLNPSHVAFLRERPSPEGSGLNQHRIDTGSHGHRPSSSHFRNAGPDSPTSFIDLSQEEDHGTSDTRSIVTHGSSKKSPLALLSPSTPSLTPAELVEVERRKKREKLAKLHRFLGSRVPTELVLGLPDHVGILPAAALSPTSPNAMPDDEGERNAWLTRRSSSGAALGANWGGELERLKEDLGGKEKAIIVRRAQKMEKVFGVPPPQTLYRQARPMSPPSGQASSPGAPGNQHSPSSALDSTGPRNVYSDYQHSLKSLVDIIDRDDKQSLVELHQYLTEDGEEDQVREAARRISVSSSIRSERRRSLPMRTSTTSLNSEYNLEPQKPQATDFQLWRRRAAKLTHFFGVDYRELIDDVLDSIEKGIEEERKKGSINPDEFEDLQRRLGDLKTKRRGV